MPEEIDGAERTLSPKGEIRSLTSNANLTMEDFADENLVPLDLARVQDPST